MKEKSVKLNFIMNIVLTGSIYVYQLIVFPYTARVLQAAGNGKVSFAISLVNYFAMFAALGIPMYGIRACASVRDDREKLSKTFHELFFLNSITTLISYVLLISISLFASSLESYRTLLLVTATLLPLQLLSAEWLFKAMEEYSYITIRSLLFKLLSILLLILFVKKQEDYVAYAWINVIGSGGSALINIRRVKRYVNPISLRKCHFAHHIKPVIGFFALSASWTIFSNLGVLLLGFLKTDYDVGLYSMATKINTILVTAITALGPVLLPRLSNYYHQENKKDMFYRWVETNFRFTVVMGVGAAVFFGVIADDIVMILGGASYLPSANCLRILLITMLLIGVSEIMGTGMLVSMGKEKITVYGTIFGIVLSTVFGLLWIPSHGIIGAAAATTIGEIAIVVIQLLFLRDAMKRIVSVDMLWKPIASAAIALCALVFVISLLAEMGEMIRVVICFCLFGTIYLFMLLIVRDKITRSVCNKIFKFFCTNE